VSRSIVNQNGHSSKLLRPGASFWHQADVQARFTRRRLVQ
jgi:hypothetical protein